MPDNSKRLTDAGFLLDASIKASVENLDENQMKFLLDLENKPMILKADDLYVVSDPKIKLRKNEATESRTIGDVTQEYNDKFRTLQKSLLRRVDPNKLVSAGKCSNGETIVIGAVSKIDGNRIVLEDQSGSIQATVPEDAKKILVDEVVAVHGYVRNRYLDGDKVLYPGVPLAEVKKTKTPCILLLVPEMDESIKEKVEQACKKANFIISLSGQEIKTPNKFSFLRAKGTMQANIEGVDVLLHNGDQKMLSDKLGVAEDEVLLELLKRRHFGVEPCLDHDVIEPVPDIFAEQSAKTYVKNYKGVTVIGLACPEVVFIDLRTRDVKVLNLLE